MSDLGLSRSACGTLRPLGRCTALVPHSGLASTPKLAGRASGTEHSAPRGYTSLAMGMLRHVVRTPPGPRFHARRRQTRKMCPGASAAATPRPGWPLLRKVTARDVTAGRARNDADLAKLSVGTPHGRPCRSASSARVRRCETFLIAATSARPPRAGGGSRPGFTHGQRTLWQAVVTSLAAGGSTAAADQAPSRRGGGRDGGGPDGRYRIEANAFVGAVQTFVIHAGSGGSGCPARRDSCQCRTVLRPWPRGPFLPWSLRAAVRRAAASCLARRMAATGW